MIKCRHQIEGGLSPKSSQPKKVCVDKLQRCNCNVCLASSKPMQVREKKSVTFDEEKLTEIFEFEDDTESQSNRKLFWEIMALDRLRFKDRISKLESIISPILSKSHRDVVFIRYDSSVVIQSTLAKTCDTEVTSKKIPEV